MKLQQIKKIIARESTYLTRMVDGRFEVKPKTPGFGSQAYFVSKGGKVIAQIERGFNKSIDLEIGGESQLKSLLGDLRWLFAADDRADFKIYRRTHNPDGSIKADVVVKQDDYA